MKKTILIFLMFFSVLYVACGTQDTTTEKTNQKKSNTILTTITTTIATSTTNLKAKHFKTKNTNIQLPEIKNQIISEETALLLMKDLYTKHIDTNIETNKYALFQCESAAKFDDIYYYLVRGFNDMEDYRATFGWYFINCENGQIYDAGPVIEELLIIPKE